MREAIDVADYGVVPGAAGSVSFNTSRVQEAIGHAYDRGPGGIVVFGPGRWNIGTLKIRTGVTIAGAGIHATQLVAHGPGNTIETESYQALNGSVLSTTAGEHSFAIRDLRLRGNTGAANGIAIIGCSYQITNVVIDGYGGWGIRSEWAAGGGSGGGGIGLESLLDAVRLVDNRSGNLRWFGPHDSMVTRSFFIERPQVVGSGSVPCNTVTGPTGGGTFFTNCHWWGTGAVIQASLRGDMSHIHASQVESATEANIAVEASECQVSGVAVYDGNKTTGPSATVGIRFGSQSVRPVGTRVDATVEYCHRAPIEFVGDGGLNTINLTTLLVNTESTPTHIGAHHERTYVRVLHGVDAMHGVPRSYLWDPVQQF